MRFPLFRKAPTGRVHTGRTATDRAPFSKIATEADILNCFRLILGRYPNPEEVRGHTMRAGEDLAGVVASYVNSLEFHRRGLLDQDNLAAIDLTELPGFKIYTSQSDAAVGRYVRDNNYDLDVTEVFRRFLRPGMRVVDIGANIGYFTMLSASLVGSSGHVLAIEPNPLNARLLEASRRANGFGQVTICQTAAGQDTKLLVLNTSHSNGTTSDLAEELNALLGAQTVPCIPVDALIDPTQRIDFIKVDVEGAEYPALLGVRQTIARNRPVIVTELSPDMMPGLSGISAAEYLRWLIGLGYQLSTVQTDGSLTAVGDDWAKILDEYRIKDKDHLDVVATPT